MTTAHAEQAHPTLTRLQWRALAAGVVGLLASVAAALLVDWATFVQSYLYAYLFWLGLTLGGMALVMLHHLVGGGWGFLIRRPLEAAAMTIPLMAVLFVPILFGMHELFEWTHQDVVAHDEILQKKTFYLNVPFFLARAAAYFVIWILLAYFLNRWSLEQDRTGNPRLARRMRDLSRAGLLLYVLTMTFAAFDWGMSLEPHWYSTIYGVIFIVSQGLSTLAFAIVLVLLVLPRVEPLARLVQPRFIHDLGNLLLALTMLWAYMNLSQFLIIWSGNLPEEAIYYTVRNAGVWGYLPPIIIALHFAVPFLLLLNRPIKRNARLLVGVAILMLVMRLVDLFWLIEPAFYHDPEHHAPSNVFWMAPLAVLGIGGLWLAALAWLLKGRPLLPLNDPRLDDVLHEVAHHE